MKRRAQEGATAAAALVAIITLLIVLYILVIPPSEREKILEGSEDSDSDLIGKNMSLFELDKAKKFYPSSEKEFEQSFGTINLFLQEEGTELKRIDSLYVEKSLVNEKMSSLSFEIINLDDAKNIMLNFIIKERRGRLIIRLNDNEIYNSEITATNIDPIKLKDYLAEGKNVLEFESSSPGLGFWKTNFYSLEDIIITADIIGRDAQESKNIFILTQSEKQNIERVRLRFFPQCTISEVGQLNIWINNHELFSAVPDCGAPSLPIEFSPSHLVTGDNILQFRTTKGRYLLEQIKLTADLEKVEPALYYFQLTDKQFNAVKNDTAEVQLYMRFTDLDEYKEADITINGNRVRLDTDEISFNKELSAFVEEGNNVIKIEPEDTLEIVEFEITLES